MFKLVMLQIQVIGPEFDGEKSRENVNPTCRPPNENNEDSRLNFDKVRREARVAQKTYWTYVFIENMYICIFKLILHIL